MINWCVPARSECGQPVMVAGMTTPSLATVDRWCPLRWWAAGPVLDVGSLIDRFAELSTTLNGLIECHQR